MSETLQPVDVKSLLSTKKTTCDFVLDGTHFGRGNVYISVYEQVKYEYTVSSLKKWEVIENENSLKNVPDIMIEHFYNNASYVVYAKYEVTAYDLNSGKLIQKKEGDSTKEVYFYWRGSYAPKGYSPLPQDLNVKEIPVERICQWAEPPIFLRLFNGRFIVHDNILNKQPHLYILCGTVKEEAHLLEVPNDKCSLRSRTSFLLVLPQEHQIYIWHGSRAYNQGFFENILQSLKEKAPDVYGCNNNKEFEIKEVNEEQCVEEFLAYLKGDVADYFTLINDPFTYQHSPRLFYLNSVTGEFIASEIHYTLGNEYLNSFPFLQDHLYTAPQPALFLLDNNHELWLWQGWKTKVTTEEQLLEFEKQRLCALDTAIRYWNEKHPTLKENIYLVAAGKEPLQFTNLFPFWVSKDGLDKSHIKFCLGESYKHISTKFFV